ncbi:MAG: DNA primase, partial [Methyloligellaceae bacterium]
MRFDSSFLDEIRARLPVSQVVSRRVQLKRQGREYKGLSPFKTEKTPSFTVNDQKAFYHCFASGEHGDIFKFLMQTEGLSFPEAVERLAGEAGVPMPVVTPEMQQRQDDRARLYDLMAVCQEVFRTELAGSAGREARRYLEGRELDDAIQHQFGLGYAPNDRSAMKSCLLKRGFTEKEAITAGMLIGGADIAVSYDRFRHRIMFPITDLKGRVIAFGGRALDPDAPAKYLNSPETPLFHKGHVLYNAAGARQSAYDSGQMVVVEGYMDVIAMARAGIPHAVAPLGTALTDTQIGLLWRMAEEPVLCFDGDAAGRKAAHRAVETALPVLKPGHSLRFAFMPAGQDPDDLLRLEGRSAVHAVLKQAKPLADVLWDKEWQAGDWNTPERRASLEATLRKLVAQIADPAVRNHYDRDISDRLFKAWRGGRNTAKSGNSTRSRSGPPHRDGTGHRAGNQRSREGWSNASTAFEGPPTSALLQSALVRTESGQTVGREALLLHVLINHPGLIDDYADEIADLAFQNNP